MNCNKLFLKNTWEHENQQTQNKLKILMNEKAINRTGNWKE